jgi:hypothetical protein
MERIRPRSLVRAPSGWDVELDCPACERIFRERFDVNTRFAECTCGMLLEIDGLSLFSSGRMKCAPAIIEAES